MEVEFANNHLEACYRTQVVGTRTWGHKVALRYGRVIDALYSANDQRELRAIRSLRLHPLKGGRAGQWAIALDLRWRVILTFDGDSTRVEEVTHHYGD